MLSPDSRTEPPSQDPTDNPIINSPYEEPQWHWTLNSQRIATTPCLPGRRTSLGINSVPEARGAGRQTSFDDESEELALVNHIRELTSQWRRQGYPGVTNTTRQLLDHWNSDQPEPRLFFAQREAIETLIYLFEVSPTRSEPWRIIRETNETYNDRIQRLALKMATGAGKTAVMALIIIWQSTNHHHSPRDRRFTNRFAIITPGITVRDRDHRDLIPNGKNNIYDGWKLVPQKKNLQVPVKNARVSVTNFHTLQLREITWGQTSNRTKKLARMVVPTENGKEMIKRALKEIDRQGSIMVLNDEGHHCHNTRTEEVQLKQEEKKNADLWFNGLLDLP